RAGSRVRISHLSVCSAGGVLSARRRVGGAVAGEVGPHLFRLAAGLEVAAGRARWAGEHVYRDLAVRLALYRDDVVLVQHDATEGDELGHEFAPGSHREAAMARRKTRRRVSATDERMNTDSCSVDQALQRMIVFYLNII